jgi:predicted ester cyclase
MTEEHHVATYRRWFDEGCSQGNVDLADELYSPEYVTHALGPEFAPTLEGLKMFIRALREGMPDLHCPVEQLVAEGDRVAGRLMLQGTHTGTLFGIPPTGKYAAAGLMVIARFDHRGKWVEDWANWDQLGFLQQLGVIPAPAAV